MLQRNVFDVDRNEEKQEKTCEDRADRPGDSRAIRIRIQSIPRGQHKKLVRGQPTKNGKDDENEYGLCANCQDEVQQKRLEAVPWARHCFACQEKHEQGLL